MADKQTTLDMSESYGFYLSTSLDTFEIRKNRRLLQQTAIKDVREIRLTEGCYVSTTALMRAVKNNAKVIFQTINGNPVAILVNTKFTNGIGRLKQYEAIHGKGLAISKAILSTKLDAQNKVMEFLGEKPIESRLEEVDNTHNYHRILFTLEADSTRLYLERLQKHFPKKLIFTERRINAFDLCNNVLSLGYDWFYGELLKGVLSVGLDSSLGFLHSSAVGEKHALIYDLADAYKPIFDYATLGFLKNSLDKGSVTTEYIDGNPRKFLAYPFSNRYLKFLDNFLESSINVQRLRSFGSQSKIRTVISEDVQRLAMFLRDERDSWSPTPILSCTEPAMLINHLAQNA